MGTIDVLNSYNYVKDDLKFTTTSSVRTKIILSLNQRDKDLNDLKIELHLESSAALHALKKLENQDIIFKKGKKYHLSSFGKIYALKSENLFKSFHAIKKCEKIWLDHRIEGIPGDFLKEIRCLSNSFLVESTPIDIIKPYNHYAELLSQAIQIKSVSPIFYYPNLNLYENILKKNADVELILTPLILEKMIKTIDKDNLKKISLLKNLKIQEIDEDVKIAFTVTEKFLSLGLFSIEGMYDATINLISYDTDAIEWGNKLFDYYLKKAQKVNLDSFK